MKGFFNPFLKQQGKDEKADKPADGGDHEHFTDTRQVGNKPEDYPCGNDAGIKGPRVKARIVEVAENHFSIIFRIGSSLLKILQVSDSGSKTISALPDFNCFNT